MLLWKVMVVWLRRVYYTILKIICKDEKWKILVKKCDLSGISAELNIHALATGEQALRWLRLVCEPIFKTRGVLSESISTESQHKKRQASK